MDAPYELSKSWVVSPIEKENNMSQAIHLETDLLVIGGGVAGSRAALDADDAGLKTLMVVKGLLGKSGCSIFAGNLNFFGAPEGEDVEEYSLDERIKRGMEFQGKYTHYLGDQEYLSNAQRFSMTEFYPWLEEHGLYLIRDEHGTIVSDQPRRTSAWAVQMGMSGTVIADLYRKLILASKTIRVLEETTVTRLLVNDGEVVGAAALDFVTSTFYIIRAKAVILATGHSNYLSERSTGTRDGSASGWVMAYEAGCRLQNLEMQWYHASDIAYPATWMRLHLYPNPMPGTTHRSQLFNSDEEMFFDSNWVGDNPVPYINQLKHVIQEVKRGKAQIDGGYYSNYRHMEPEVLENWFYQAQFTKKIGVDLSTQLMENGLTWHMNVGGVHVDGQTMESDLPGLLIAGSVGALVTGGLNNVTWDGVVAARQAEQRVRSLSDLKPLNNEQVAAEEARIYGLFRTEPAEGLLPGQVKKRIRKVMWEKHNYIKTEASMQEALDDLLRIEAEDVPRMRLQTDTKRFNYDWVDALDAVDMLEALKLEVQFCLYRKESRGAFYREDYPNTDNQNWLVHIMGRKGSDGELHLETEPVDLPYASPAETIASFFDVDY